MIGLSTMWGGVVGHALQHYVGFSWKTPGWITGMISIALIERMAIFHARPYMHASVGRFFAMLNIAELIALLFITLYTMKFIFVEVHGAYGMLLVVSGFEIFVWTKTKKEASRNILIAIGLTTIAAAIHIFKLSPHDWFNHLDLSHVVLVIAVYFFYKGAVQITNHIEVKPELN